MPQSDRLFQHSSKLDTISKFLFHTPCGEVVFYGTIWIVLSCAMFFGLYFGYDHPDPNGHWLAGCIVMSILGPPAAALSGGGIFFVGYFGTKLACRKIRETRNIMKNYQPIIIAPDGSPQV